MWCRKRNKEPVRNRVSERETCNEIACFRSFGSVGEIERNRRKPERLEIARYERKETVVRRKGNRSWLVGHTKEREKRSLS